MESLLSLLVVDDDAKILETVSEALKPLFANIYTSLNVSDAMKICKERRIHIAITDLLLPGKDGFDLIELLKKNTKTIGIPVIIITGVRIDPKAIARAKDLKVDKFISKPFNLEELKSSVTACLAKDYRSRKILTAIEDLKLKEQELEEKKKENIQKCKNNLMEINKNQRLYQRELTLLQDIEYSDRAEKLKKHVESLKEKSKETELQLSNINTAYKQRHIVLQKTRLSVYKRMKDIDLE